MKEDHTCFRHFNKQTFHIFIRFTYSDISHIQKFHIFRHFAYVFTHLTTSLREHSLGAPLQVPTSVLRRFARCTTDITARNGKFWPYLSTHRPFWPYYVKVWSPGMLLRASLFGALHWDSIFHLKVLRYIIWRLNGSLKNFCLGTLFLPLDPPSPLTMWVFFCIYEKIF